MAETPIERALRIERLGVEYSTKVTEALSSGDREFVMRKDTLQQALGLAFRCGVEFSQHGV